MIPTRTHDRRSRPQKTQLALTVREGPDAGIRQLLREGSTLAVGTAEDNELRLSDPHVSRYHLELRYVEGRVELRDLKSRNGTFVGSERVRVYAAQLSQDCSLYLGDTRLALDDGGEVRDPLPPTEDAQLPGLIARSEAMCSIARRARQLAASNVSVLIRGETGSGKELIAEALHTISPRSAGPFVVVDCGSMPATLIASELFGHERGSFTGAERQHSGAFERARGGTLFLDEIGELPIQVQPALLGALERRRIRRVGGSQDLDIDVRIVAATHRDLRAEVNRGGFRADLYYRLAAARLVVPPLRERPEDIEPLVRHFVEHATGRADPLPFGADAMEALRTHRWSGNARELRNVVENALAVGSVELEQTRSQSGREPRERVVASADGYAAAPYRQARAQALAKFEEAYLTDLMGRCDANASEAARRAQMDRGYLLTLLRKHDLR
jgi:DNA-binding NtrC family response regulator